MTNRVEYIYEYYCDDEIGFAGDWILHDVLLNGVSLNDYEDEPDLSPDIEGEIEEVERNGVCYINCETLESEDVEYIHTYRR